MSGQYYNKYAQVSYDRTKMPAHLPNTAPAAPAAPAVPVPQPVQYQQQQPPIPPFPVIGHAPFPPPPNQRVHRGPAPTPGLPRPVQVNRATPVAPVASSSSSTQPAPLRSDRPFECDQCRSGYASPEGLAHHVSVRQRCGKGCRRGFCRTKDLKEHEKTCRG